MHKFDIYLGSPFTHEDPKVMEERYKEALQAAAWLMKKGKTVYAAIPFSYHLSIEGGIGLGWNEWKLQDKTALICSYQLFVLQLDGWQESVGLNEEIEWAQSLGMPISFMSVNLLDSESYVVEPVR